MTSDTSVSSQSGRPRVRVVLALSLALAISTCTKFGPDYARPEIDIGKSFVGGASAEVTNGATRRWWRDFNDPLLSELVEAGIRDNLSIKAALARFDAADASARQAGLAALPQGSLTAKALQQGPSGVPQRPDFGALRGRYVIDLFGRTARSQEAAFARREASSLDAGSARLGVIAEIVSSYVEARYAQRAVAITGSSIESYRATNDQVAQLRSAQRATELDVQSTRAELAFARAQLPQLESGLASQLLRLSTLTGVPYSDLRTKFFGTSAQPSPKPLSKVGVPADLLRNRPDIRSAEQALAAATAEIGVAEADLYPSLSFDGNLRFDLLNTFDIGAVLNIPILNETAIESSRDLANARMREAEANWRDAVMSAIEEVNVELHNYASARRQYFALREVVEARERVRVLVEEGEEAGRFTMAEVITAQKAVYDARLQAANAVRAYTQSWAALHVRTGQGWAEPPQE